MTSHQNTEGAQTLPGKLWIPVQGFEQHLHTELQPASEQDTPHQALDELLSSTSLVYRTVYPACVCWAQLCFERPFIVHFGSITEAAQLLRAIQRNWAHYPVQCFRRAALIEAQLPYISKKKRTFPYRIPLANMGVWSLLDAHTLIASAQTSSPLPLGTVHFEEDHCNPPSRAYLKLWEALALLDYYFRKKCTTLQGPPPHEWALPHNSSHCIDAGASPGGWSWVLHELGASILAIDRSPLAATLMHASGIHFMQHDTFTLTPEQLGPQDWIFSDVICYPPRLYAWIEKWLTSGLCSKFVCTIKMQGEPDFETLHRFAAIPHSKIVHVTANKHELTWLHAPFLEA
ncbi:MAG: SAM-dependent methyltransferase [Treponema sp.]